MTKKLEDLDFSEIEKRFIAQAGSMEIVKTNSVMNRRRYKALHYNEVYGGKLTDYNAQVMAAEKFMRAYSAYAQSIGCTVIDDAINVETPEQAEKLNVWWAEHTGPTRRIPTEPETQK